MPRFRTGTKVALNVYDGDRPIFQAHSEEDATRLVYLLNLGQVTLDKAMASTESPLSAPETASEPSDAPEGPGSASRASVGALSILRRMHGGDRHWEWEIEVPDGGHAPRWVRVDAESRKWEYREPLTDAERAAWELVEGL